MSPRARSWPACKTTRRRRTAWCTSSCPAKSERSKSPAMCRREPSSTLWMNCAACRAAEGFGESNSIATEENMAETAQQYTQRILNHVEGQDALKVQKQSPAKLKKLVKGLSSKQLRWKPGPGKWSIAEILAHLADAEIVGSWRMCLIVGTNGVTIQPFDQDAWAAVFQYGKRDTKTALEVFRILRENNLIML